MPYLLDDRDRAPSTVAIIGGGIAGLTLAIALHQRSIPVKIYEQAAKFTEIGAGLGFTPNAIRAMAACSPDLLEAFGRVATGSSDQSNKWFTWLDGHSPSPDPTDPSRQSLLFDIDMAYGERKGNAVHRPSFLAEVLKLLPAETAEFGKRLDCIDEERPSGKLSMRFADGSVRQADIVIGSDGIKSRTRQLVLGEQNPASYPSYTHKYAYRGLIPMEKAMRVLPEDVITRRRMHLGPDGHLITFPVAKGKLLNVVAYKSSAEPWTHHGLVKAASKEKALQDFAGWHANVQAIISLMPDSLDSWAIFDHGAHPAPTYHRGRTIITGDAAHASSPHHGAGAGLGVEDSLVLAELLACAAASKLAPHTALEAAAASFSAARMQRTQWLVQSSRRVGDMFDLRDAETRGDMGRLRAEVEARNCAIWEADVEGMVRVARDEFARRSCGCLGEAAPSASL